MKSVMSELEKIKRTGLSNVDIEYLCRGVSGFLGVYMNDQLNLLSSLMKDKSVGRYSGVINWDNSDQAGVHWCSFIYDAGSGLIFYYDPMGFPPKKNFTKLAKSLRAKVLFSDNIKQTADWNCGVLAVKFLL